MAVAEHPAAIAGLLANLLQEVCQFIPWTVKSLRKAAGRAVGDDVVHRPAVDIQVPPGLGILFLRRQLLRPPGLTYDPILPSALSEQTEESFAIVR